MYALNEALAREHQRELRHQARSVDSQHGTRIARRGTSERRHRVTLQRRHSAR